MYGKTKKWQDFCEKKKKSNVVALKSDNSLAVWTDEF